LSFTAGVFVSVFVVFVKGVSISLVVVKKGMLKSIIGAVNHNEKQEEEEVGLPPSSDRKGGNTIQLYQHLCYMYYVLLSICLVVYSKGIFVHYLITSR
jgi:hypothetical protein